MKDNDRAKRIAFNRQAGTRLSAYEHLIPEKFWTNAQNPGEGVSAVKALAKAAAEGQKIYTLTSQNASAVYQLQIDDAARAEIQNALNAGRTVTAHEKPITVSGWTGSGYIIEDTATGAGAYKISGGANGGALIAGIESGVLLVGTLFFGITGFGTLFGAISIFAAVLTIALIAYYEILDSADCFNSGFGIGIGWTLEVIGGLPTGVGTLLGILIQWKLPSTPIWDCVSPAP